MKRVRPWFVFLALATVLWPARMNAGWEIVEYDGQTDWVRHDFVGWVRVEQAVKPAKAAKGIAVVALKVIEKLAGEETAPTLTLEYEAATVSKPGDEPGPAGKHDWHEDLPEHREYFVFLDRLANGAYRCGEQRDFPVRDGAILDLPGAYAALGNRETAPKVHELIARARTSLPALRVRSGRPDLGPPLVEKGRPVETPQQGFERIRAALQGGNPQELERSIHSPDGSAPKGMKALLQQEREHLVAWPVQWQAVLEDKAVVVLGPPGQPAMTLFLMRRGPHWLLLNTQPDTEAGRLQLNLLLTQSQFAILTVVVEREYRAR
jgi:hypothetical protein